MTDRRDDARERHASLVERHTLQERAALVPSTLPNVAHLRESKPLNPKQLSYLRDLVTHPFSPALDRDDRLGLSRYQGVQVRRRLSESGLVAMHRISTGRRAGQLLLLQLTPVGAQEVGGAGLSAEVFDRDDFLRRFYVHQLGAFAARTWPGATVSMDRAPGSNHGSHDLTVLIPAVNGSAAKRSVAFRIEVDGDADMSALACDLDRFDEVYLWAASPQAAAALQRKADEYLGGPAATRVRCTPIAVSLSDPRQDPAETPPAGKRSRLRRSRPRTQLHRQLVRAYEHIHDLDWLQDSPLAELEAVRGRANQLSPMPEAQALRALLVEAAKRAARYAGEVPTQAPLRGFIESYLEGKQIKEIAADLGVSREWCSRAYRKQALELAARQCERLIAVGTQRSSE